jgi:hypothetical protein
MSWLLGLLTAFGPWVLDRLLDLQQRQRVRVEVHPAHYESGGASVLSTPDNMVSVPTTGYGPAAGQSLYWFLTVINLSPKRRVCVTHAWFGADPPVPLVQPPWKEWLDPDGGFWDGCVNDAHLAHASNIERLGRVKLANRRRPIKSRPAKHVPPKGYVARPWRSGP